MNDWYPTREAKSYSVLITIEATTLLSFHNLTCMGSTRPNRLAGRPAQRAYYPTYIDRNHNCPSGGQSSTTSILGKWLR